MENVSIAINDFQNYKKEMNKEEQYIVIEVDDDYNGTLKINTHELECIFEVENLRIKQIAEWVVEDYPIYEALNLLYDMNMNRMLYGEKEKLGYLYIELLDEGETGNPNNIKMYKHLQEL